MWDPRKEEFVRALQPPSEAWAKSDPDLVALLAKETTDAGHSILVFCPSKKGGCAACGPLDAHEGGYKGGCRWLRVHDMRGTASCWSTPAPQLSTCLHQHAWAASNATHASAAPPPSPPPLPCLAESEWVGQLVANHLGEVAERGTAGGAAAAAAMEAARALALQLHRVPPLQVCCYGVQFMCMHVFNSCIHVFMYSIHVHACMHACPLCAPQPRQAVGHKLSYYPDGG